MRAQTSSARTRAALGIGLPQLEKNAEANELASLYQARIVIGDLLGSLDKLFELLVLRYDHTPRRVGAHFGDHALAPLWLQCCK